MRDSKRGLRSTLFLVALALVAAVVLLPNAGADPEAPIETWVATSEAQARTLNGECEGISPTAICLQLCVTFQGNTHQMPDFQCFEG